MGRQNRSVKPCIRPRDINCTQTVSSWANTSVPFTALNCDPVFERSHQTLSPMLDGLPGWRRQETTPSLSLPENCMESWQVYRRVTRLRSQGFKFNTVKEEKYSYIKRTIVVRLLLLFIATSLLVKNHRQKSFILTSKEKLRKWLSHVYEDLMFKSKKGNFQKGKGEFQTPLPEKKIAHVSLLLPE